MNIEKISNLQVVYHDVDFDEPPSNDISLISLYGKIKCGEPNFINDYREAVLEIPQRMIGQGDFFALRARGDSMVGAGINDGDILIVKMQEYAENGQIVVARIDQEVTLKRFYLLKDERKYLLHPENSVYEDIITDSCTIMGVAVKIIKNIEEE